MGGLTEMIRLIALFLIFIAGNIFAGGKTQSQQRSESPHFQNENEEAEVPPGQSQQNRGEQVMKALAAAYPLRIEKVEYRNGDWAVFLEGKWFYYASGRLMPEELLYMTADYNPQTFYNYISELPSWSKPSAEQAARFSEMINNRTSNPPRRSQHFFDALWRAHSHEEAYQRVKSIRFLGKPVMVHYSILEDLCMVEEQIMKAAAADPQVRSWVNSINTLDGWSWRNIADTQSRSFHAYGAAIDILPKSLGGKETYWLWAASSRPEWWNISYNERFHPPDAVIKAFELYGFIWGGKWLMFDTMHFEYRPEILILSGMPPASIQ
jgi:hypothetical protein